MTKSSYGMFHLVSGDEIGRTNAGAEPVACLVHQEVSNTEPAESDRSNVSNELWRGVYSPADGETVTLQFNSTYINATTNPYTRPEPDPEPEPSQNRCRLCPLQAWWLSA